MFLKIICNRILIKTNVITYLVDYIFIMYILFYTILKNEGKQIIKNKVNLS